MKVNRSTAGALALAGAAILAERYGPVVAPYAGLFHELEKAKDQIASIREASKGAEGTRYDMVRAAILAGHNNNDSGEFVRIGVTAALEAAGVSENTLRPYAGTIEKAVDWLGEARGDDDMLNIRLAQVADLDMNNLRAAMKGEEFLELEETLKLIAKRAKHGAKIDLPNIMEVLQQALSYLPEIPEKKKGKG